MQLATVSSDLEHRAINELMQQLPLAESNGMEQYFRFHSNVILCSIAKFNIIFITQVFDRSLVQISKKKNSNPKIFIWPRCVCLRKLLDICHRLGTRGSLHMVFNRQSRHIHYLGCWSTLPSWSKFSIWWVRSAST